MAERFGWTEEQVDETSAETVDWMIAIGRMVDAERATKEAERLQAMFPKRPG